MSQISKEKHDFFPLFHALALEEGEDEKAKQLDEVKTMVEKILKRFEEEVRKRKLPIIIIIGSYLLTIFCGTHNIGYYAYMHG